MVLRLSGVFLTVFKIPGFRVKTIFAVMCTAADKKGGAYSGTVGYITFFDLSVVHPVHSLKNIFYIDLALAARISYYIWWIKETIILYIMYIIINKKIFNFF